MMARPQQCTGIIEANFSNVDSNFIQIIDEDIQKYLQKLPGWVEIGCKAALRVELCLQHYLPSGSSICRETCQEIQDACQGFFELSGQTFFSLDVASCEDLPSVLGNSILSQDQIESKCISGGDVLAAYDAPAFQLDAPVTCPVPLVVPEFSPGSPIPGTGCAIGCPGWLSPPSHMATASRVLSWTGLFTFPFGLFSLATLLVFRRKRHRPSLMFCLGTFMVSTISSLTALGTQIGSSSICDGNARESWSAGCKAQGFFLVFALLWSYCWAVGHIWDIVFRDIKSHYSLESCDDRFRRNMIFSCVVTFICCLGLLCANGFGYNMRSLLPVCFLRRFSGGGSWIQWTFFWAPILLLICLTLPALVYILNYTGNSLQKTQTEREELLRLSMMRSQAIRFFYLFVVVMIIVVAVCARKEETADQDTARQTAFIKCSLQYWTKSYEDRAWICSKGAMPSRFVFQICISLCLGIFGALPFLMFGKSHLYLWKEIFGENGGGFRALIAVARRGFIDSDHLQPSIDVRQLTRQRQFNKKKQPQFNSTRSRQHLLQEAPFSDAHSPEASSCEGVFLENSSAAPAVDLEAKVSEDEEPLNSDHNFRDMVRSKALRLLHHRRGSSLESCLSTGSEFAAAQGTLRSDTAEEHGFNNSVDLYNRKASAFVDGGSWQPPSPSQQRLSILHRLDYDGFEEEKGSREHVFKVIKYGDKDSSQGKGRSTPKVVPY